MPLAVWTGLELVVVSETILVERPPNTNAVEGLLVVWTLRLRSQCAACHAKPKGTLLGALVYTLVREGPVPNHFGTSLPRTATGVVGELPLECP